MRSSPEFLSYQEHFAKNGRGLEPSTSVRRRVNDRSDAGFCSSVQRLGPVGRALGVGLPAKLVLGLAEGQPR